MTLNENIADFATICKNYDIKNRDRLVDRLRRIGFFTAPASTKYHGNYEGGLYDHSRTVFKHLDQLTRQNLLKWDREESPLIVGMFHDLCKCDTYKTVDDVIVYNDDTLLTGHGDKSIEVLSTIMRITEEEMLCIRYHMGAFAEKDEWNRYTNAIHKCPNVLWTHHADMLAAHVSMT